VFEPVHRLHLEIPADTFGAVLPVLARLRALPGAPVIRGSLCLLDGEIPAAQVRELEEQLPSLTRGEGVLEATFGHYQPVRGDVPGRPRTDHNPLNREEYLLRVARRVAARWQGRATAGWERESSRRPLRLTLIDGARADGRRYRCPGRPLGPGAGPARDGPRARHGRRAHRCRLRAAGLRVQALPHLGAGAAPPRPAV